ncbi:pyridoxal-phosphate dependent enzyme [Streptomyces sp. NPDC058664]|uniref:pyridoxal-phosphate dependent enzyme n=1 Tax=unclassified Streptomyces TaxID=2593676 RepID=UPI00364BF180
MYSGQVEITLSGVNEMRRILGDSIRHTPLLQSRGRGSRDVFLKCENLQITNSFKVRGAIGALRRYEELHPEIWKKILRDGVVACSSGNFAQGLAYATREIGVDYSVVVPEGIVASKVVRIKAYNPEAQIIEVPYGEWRKTMTESVYAEHPGFFLSSESDDYVSLSTATIALEVLQDMPHVDAILVPYGGGNLSYSISSVLRHAGLDVKVYAVEVATGAPLSASLRAGFPVDVNYEPSFVDGIGASFVIPSQFERVKGRLAGVLTVTPDEVAGGLTDLLLNEKIVCEGAGAAAYTAARKYEKSFQWEYPCAIVSGGVIDPSVLMQALRQNLRPRPLPYNAAA